MTRVVVCLDGFDPAYLSAVETPHWDAIADQGTSGRCQAVVPTLTNVNNVSLATASPPSVHGVTGNTAFDEESGDLRYVESATDRRVETWLAAAEARGESTAVLVVKEKLAALVGDGAGLVAAAESPPADLEEAVGAAPDIYSGDASAWILDAARYVVERDAPDYVYVSTTDVIPHRFPPGSDRATVWTRGLDDALGALAEQADALVATADHGMNEKTVCVDLERCLAEEGVEASVAPLIRDAHVYHHQNLGGAAALALDDPADAASLRDVEGVDLILDREEAAERFDLPRDGLGDVLVLGTEPAVFGPLDPTADDPNPTHAPAAVRSHGSHHERDVPYVATEPGHITHNYEAVTFFE